MEKYYIIYPRGDTSRLKVEEINEHNIMDYKVASRHSYYSLNEALDNALMLAKKFGLTLENGGLLD